MLDLHVKKVIGHVPVDKLDYRMIAYWVKSMMAKGRSPKTIKNVHGLISASMNTAEMLGYITRNPCRGVQLPSVEKAEDEMMFLTHAEFGLIMDGMGGAVQGLHQLPSPDGNALRRGDGADCGGHRFVGQAGHRKDKQGLEAGRAEPVLHRSHEDRCRQEDNRAEPCAC
ncbi:hypothetical protein StoSoilB5_19110 [Arthrobacter sp. StoSoilB5]|nr:hypothetical protein StoSoilB5_19110 [Arthrobacter sp. StoSoilB5]